MIRQVSSETAARIRVAVLALATLVLFVRLVVDIVGEDPERFVLL